MKTSIGKTVKKFILDALLPAGSKIHFFFHITITGRNFIYLICLLVLQNG